MKGLKTIFLFLIFFTLIHLFGCAKSPSGPDTIENSYNYFVNIPSLGIDALHIRLQIYKPEPGDSIRLLAPPIYADNPWLEPTASNFHNVSVVDAADKPIEYVSDSVAVGLYKSLSISLPNCDSILTIDYDVTFNYVDTVNMPVPYIDNVSGYLQGSYIFLIPYNSIGMADIWRSNYNISVNYSVATNISFYGDPAPLTYFDNPYELLFSTGALNANLLAQGETGDQPYQFVFLPKGEAINPQLVQKVKEDFEIILNDITSIFNPFINTPVSVIFGVNKGGGLEGMYAFSILNPWENDSTGWINMILAHEVIHFWIGNRVGDYEDPWWKEGTASYLGYQIALRNNLCSDYFINRKLLKNLSNDSGVNAYALSDPEVRKYIFAQINNCESLVYDKGAQVSMLLDRRIRETSDSRTSLCGVLGEFVKEYDGKAFYRGEYLSYIKNLSGADVSDIFTDYVETIGAIPDTVLTENCTALINMGAFGDINLSSIKGDEKELQINAPTRW